MTITPERRQGRECGGEVTKPYSYEYQDDPSARQCWSCYCDHPPEVSCEGSKSEMAVRRVMQAKPLDIVSDKPTTPGCQNEA